jgi:hypothetical protein
MRMSDEEYFRSCIAKERHLAHLLGHPDVEEFYESAGTLWEGTKAMPKWTRDWKACGPLMTQYDIPVVYNKEVGQDHTISVTAGSITVHFSDHPAKERAVMYAIVKAVIALIEHGKARKHH